MRPLAPVVLFVYKRIDCLKQTVMHLQNNLLAKESDLIIFSDSGKHECDKLKVQNVREYISTIKGFKTLTIYRADENKGLASSVIEGVSSVLEKYGKAIVLEDDIITSQDFLTFMNEGLNFYENNEKIWSITGYCPPIKIPKYYKEDIFLCLRPSSWGWATWKDRWLLNDWELNDYESLLRDRRKQRAFNKGGYDLYRMLNLQMRGKLDSWAIRWSYSQFCQAMYSVYPVQTRVEHIGEGEDATHVKKAGLRGHKLSQPIGFRFKNDLMLDEKIAHTMQKLHLTSFKLFLKRIDDKLIGR